MNTINFQPTGIYPQIAKNPNLINSSVNKQEEKPVWETRGYKIKKTAIEALIVGGIVAAGALICHYNKGMKAIKLKDKLVPEKLPEEKTFLQYVEECAYTYEEKDFVIKAYNEGLKYEKSIVGKINNGINAISSFFKNNFYGYKTPKK